MRKSWGGEKAGSERENGRMREGERKDESGEGENGRY